MANAGHRVHGMGPALEVPTWPAITALEARAMLARFPNAGQLLALRWHSPRPFSAAALIRTSEGQFLLKRHHRHVRTPAALAEEHGFMAHLRSAGLPVPEVVAAADGVGAVAQGDWTYELHRKALGIDLYRDRPSWTPFLVSRHAFAAGAMLGRLHVAARGFTAPVRGPHALIASFSILPSPDPLAAAEAYVAARPALAGFLQDIAWRQELARLFAPLAGGLSDRLIGQPPLWTHNDWHPSNMLWSPDDTVSTVFDFGLATRTCALHDIATAVERTAIPWLQLAQGAGDEPADVDAALAILAGYRTIVPLTRADVATIVRLLPLVHVEFALCEIDYFAGVLGDRRQAMHAWRHYLIDHATWFLTAPGRDFLHRLAVGAAHDVDT